MARALIVGCGCRGRALAAALMEDGWQARGTSRRAEGVAAIEAVGAEGALADPDRIGTLVEHVEGVAVVYWLLGSARGEEEHVAALHGPRLERMLEEIVDTPVRGFVYEAAGSVGAAHLAAGAAAVRAAGERWRIPVATPAPDPADAVGWPQEMAAAAEELLDGGGR